MGVVACVAAVFVMCKGRIVSWFFMWEGCIVWKLSRVGFASAGSCIVREWRSAGVALYASRGLWEI